jgi:hypothetical protein
VVAANDRFKIKLRVAPSVFSPSKNRGVPHISLVFREMWETTALHLPLLKVDKKVKVRGLPHLAKNERDMGHPTILGREKTKRNLIFQSRAARSFVQSNQGDQLFHSPSWDSSEVQPFLGLIARQRPRS